METKNKLLLDASAKKVLDNPHIIAALLRIIYPENFYHLSISEIVQKYLKKSIVNPDKIDTNSEEAAPEIGIQTRFDKHLHLYLPIEKKIANVEIEFENSNSTNLSYREMDYEAKLIAEQKHSAYKDFNPVASAWIIMKPNSEERNKIYFKMEKTFEFLETKEGYEIKELANRETNSLGRIVEINIGGPEDNNFTGEIKLIYDLFHNNQEEVKQFFIENGVKDFDYRKVFENVMEYKTYEEQVRDEAKNEGLEQGKQEGIKEGESRKELEIYNRMLKNGLSPELAHKCAYGS